MQRINVRRKDQWSDWCEMFWFLKIFLLSYILMRKRQRDIINVQLVSITFMRSLFTYEHLGCHNKTSNSFFCSGTLVSSSNISAQAHFIFHQTIIQSKLCLQLSPSCQHADDMILAASTAGLCSLVPGLRGWDRWKKDPVITGESWRQKQRNSWTQESGCLPPLKTLPEQPERDALARFQTRDPVFLFSWHYSRVHIWHGSADIGDNDSFLDPKITENKLFLSVGKQSGRITGAIYKSNITQNSNEGTHSCCRSDVLRGKYQICRI